MRAHNVPHIRGHLVGQAWSCHLWGTPLDLWVSSRCLNGKQPAERSAIHPTTDISCWPGATYTAATHSSHHTARHDRSTASLVHKHNRGHKGRHIHHRATTALRGVRTSPNTVTAYARNRHVLSASCAAVYHHKLCSCPTITAFTYCACCCTLPAVRALLPVSAACLSVCLPVVRLVLVAPFPCAGVPERLLDITHCR